MKKFAFVAGWIAILLINIWYLYDSFEYFSKDLTDLIYVFAITIVGGIAFWIYSKCSQKWRRRIQLILLGLMATGYSLICITILVIAIQFSRYPFDREMILYLVIIAAFVAMGACYSWWQFCQRLRKRREN
jgi:hypothetical protein